MNDQIIGGNKPPTTADGFAKETPERQRALHTPAPIVEMPAEEAPIANEPVGAPGRRVSTLLG
jgi:hypothetical protein